VTGRAGLPSAPRNARANRAEDGATPFRSAPVARAEGEGIAPVASRGVRASLLLMWLIGSAMVMLAYVLANALGSRM
jgi:hypothetical protein